jgi:dihydropteroate synthase
MAAATGPVVDCAGRRLDLSRPRIMGVLNITPDSFSDGGRWLRDGRPDLDTLRRAAAAMVAAGAAVIDVGGESTRPGAAPVSEQQELERVLPVVEALVAELDAVVSVDTSTPAVMRAAAAAGAGMLNDVRALQREGALEAAATCRLPVCLMHMQGTPATMQEQPVYTEVLDEVESFLRARIAACTAAGLPRESLLLDPGFGFGKTVQHNLQLLAGLPRLAALGLPLLVGLSRKSLLATLTGRPVEQRLAGSLALALLAAQRGACLLRVHDVEETGDVLRVLAALEETAVGMTAAQSE